MKPDTEWIESPPQRIGNAIVTVRRPVLSKEEYEKRLETFKAAMVQFWLAKIRMEKEKERLKNE